MPIARSAPIAVSAIEIARAKSTILTVSHRDKVRTQSCQHFFRDGREDRGREQQTNDFMTVSRAGVPLMIRATVGGSDWATRGRRRSLLCN
jgi:hypothetical protein